MNHRDERRVSSAVSVNQNGKVAKCYSGRAGDSLLYSCSICEVHRHHIAILHGLSGHIHLVNKDGIFQKSISIGGVLVQPTSLLFNESTEKPVLFVAYQQQGTLFHRIRIYDYNSLLAENLLVELFYYRNVDSVVDDRNQASVSKVQQPNGGR